MSSSMEPTLGCVSYPNLVESQKKLLPEKTDVLTIFFKQKGEAAEKLPRDPTTPLTLDQRKVKWLDERLKRIDEIFKGVHGEPQPSDDDKRELLNKFASGDCEPALVSICESFIANVGGVKSDEVVSHLTREMKRAVIQKIITSNAIVKKKYIHTINAMNLLIKERASELGISKEDPLYLKACEDTYTGGVRGAISDEVDGHVEEYLDTLVDKFSSTYTKNGLVGFALDWINELQRKTLRQGLATLLSEKIESKYEDPSAYVFDVCLEKNKEDEPLEYMFTKEGVELLFEEELKAIGQTFSEAEKIVKENGLKLKELSEKWQKSPKIVRAAYSQNPEALQYAAREIALLLIKEDPRRLVFASQDVQKDTSFLLELVKGNPAVISFFPEAIKLDKAFLLSAVEQHAGAFGYVPESLTTGKEFMLSLLNAFSFGEKKWEKYFGFAGEIPELPADIVEILRSSCPYVKDKKVAETHFLMLVPATVNGKSFNLENLEELVKAPKSTGHATKYRYFEPDVKKKYGKATPETSRWVLMTKDVIPNSRNETYAKQKILLEQCSDYKVPDLLSAATCILMNFVDKDERLYSDDPYTYTRCEETVESYQTAVGGLAPAGLVVYNPYFDSVESGVAALRKFL